MQEKSSCIMPKMVKNHIPDRRWNCSIVWKRSGWDPERGEEHKDDLQGESDGSQPLHKITDDSEARKDFWSIEGH